MSETKTRELRCLGLLFLTASVMLVALVSSGCDTGVRFAEVKGTVQVDGKLLETGSIDFFPVDGKSPTAGAPIKDGVYVAKVPTGLMKVFMSAPVVYGKKKLYDAPNSPEQPLYRETLPDKYTIREKTVLELEVKPGINQKDWDLTTK